MAWLKLFLPFAGAYFLSYHFRTANAVVGPVLAGELALGAADLGLLTSTYFLAFGLAQLPVGVLLDRFGARRVEVVLLIVAAAGALLFANAHEIFTLAVGRGLIGVGVSACLMGSFKFFSQRFPRERQASLTGWIMTSGSLGALAASVPLDAALHFAGWRTTFFALALITLAVAAAIHFCVPEQAQDARPESLKEQLAGLKTIVGSAHFWRYAPLGFTQIGGFMAVQTLWSSGWLMNVNGYTRSVAADHLALMSLAMLVSYALIGLLASGLARRGVGVIVLLAGGMVMALLALALIIAQRVDEHWLLWMAYGLFSSVGTLAFPQVAAGFPIALGGRANTALNLVVMLGAFGFQWGIGGLIDLMENSGLATPVAYRNAFLLLFGVQTAACLWLLLGGRLTRRAALPAGKT
jgi:predicted MFS family arabinose efflux permease